MKSNGEGEGKKLFIRYLLFMYFVRDDIDVT